MPSEAKETKNEATSKVVPFDINAPRQGKKMEHVPDGEYVFGIRSLAIYTDKNGDKILFVNTSTDEADGLCPSLRFNVDTDQGLAWFDDFVAEVAGTDEAIPPSELPGLQFTATKLTTEDGYHNISASSVRAL